MKVVASMLTTEELAVRWKMNPHTLDNWRGEKKGPPYIKLGRKPRSKVLYRVSDILEWEKHWSRPR